jgi:hypothetical protein
MKMIDTLVVTTDEKIDPVNLCGEKVSQSWSGETMRKKIYRFSVAWEHFFVSYEPHKFGECRNNRIGYTRVDTHPGEFESYVELLSELCVLFGCDVKRVLSMKVTRVDICADVVGLSVSDVQRMFCIDRVHSYNVYKGTIYAGSDPKYRIYDKRAEIRSREQMGKNLSVYDKRILQEKICTRFEIQVKKGCECSLGTLPVALDKLLNNFNNLNVYNYPDIEKSPFFQTLYSGYPRKFRERLSEFWSGRFVEDLKARCKSGISAWLSGSEEYLGVPELQCEGCV